MSTHITVMKEEAVEGLSLTPGMTVVDATLGSGGHTKRIIEALEGKGTLISLDADPEAVKLATSIDAGTVTFTALHENFRNIDTALDTLGITTVDAILADLGWRMEQFIGGERGFSFQHDEPLLMTYGDPADYAFIAKDIINEWSLDSIANVLKGYGEERHARRIARMIVEEREIAPIETSGQLAELVSRAVPSFFRKHRKVHPATQTFQALRIAVNDELQAVEEFIEKAVSRLTENGRLAIITFHSLEDRIVKHRFRSLQEEGQGIIITKKPRTAGDEELLGNPRSRSAKLRIFEKK